MEDKKQINEETIEKAPDGRVLQAGEFESIGKEERKAMLKSWLKMDREAIRKVPTEVLDKITGGAWEDDDDDPWQWYWVSKYNCPYCGEPLIAYAPNDEIEYLFCGCGFDERYW